MKTTTETEKYYAVMNKRREARKAFWKGTRESIGLFLLVAGCVAGVWLLLLGLIGGTCFLFSGEKDLNRLERRIVELESSQLKPQYSLVGTNLIYIGQ